MSWTDAEQGCIMLIALMLVPIVLLMDIGGITPTFHLIAQVDLSRLELFKGTTVMGMISFLAWGLQILRPASY